MTWNRATSVSWSPNSPAGPALRRTGLSNQPCSQLNWVRTQAFKYQLKPSVISVAPREERVGSARRRLPGAKTWSPISKRETRATNSHAPGQVNGCDGSKLARGVMGWLYDVRSSPVSRRVVNTYQPSVGTLISMP